MLVVEENKKIQTQYIHHTQTAQQVDMYEDTQVPSLENWDSGLKIFYGSPTFPTYCKPHTYLVCDVLGVYLIVVSPERLFAGHVMLRLL